MDKNWWSHLSQSYARRIKMFQNNSRLKRPHAIFMGENGNCSRSQVLSEIISLLVLNQPQTVLVLLYIHSFFFNINIIVFMMCWGTFILQSDWTRYHHALQKNSYLSPTIHMQILQHNSLKPPWNQNWQ